MTITGEHHLISGALVLATFVVGEAPSSPELERIVATIAAGLRAD